MFLTVVTASRAGAIAKGLTYETNNTAIAPGCAVKIPLRKKIIEGIVIDVMEKKMQTEFDLRSICDVIGESPILTPAQIHTIQWMSQYYCCTLRQALQVWLPAPPWSRLLKNASAIKNHTTSIHGIPHLTEAQQSAYESIRKDTRPSLLFGITGSGKTEVYAAMIADVIAQGRQAILLVPEILLTEHIIERFEKLLPRDCISVLHSKLKATEKRAEWNRIHSGEAVLVIGSRSALFAPAQNLGIIIIDEEHEWTYKNEQTPRYNARETAEALCRFAKAKLVLGSATPSLESWYRAEKQIYHLSRLPERYGSGKLPTVTVVDLADVEFGKQYPFSPQLIDAMRDRLDRGEQSVLFLNRRGAASALLCLQCRRRVISPESQLPFTVHHRSDGRPYLLDHSTGTRADVPSHCPHCKSPSLIEVGAGTQRVESIVKKLFPKARLLRADADTLESPEQMRTLLKKMKNAEADILLGTQSVVKGLDLPNVTLAAVLLADVGMSLPHFRAGERTMQLLTQLTGRSGRTKQGHVIIQTFRPEADEVKAAALHQTEKYLNDELRIRAHAGYPPAVQMVRLIIRGAQAEAKSKVLTAEAIRHQHQLALRVRISSGPTFFGAGKIHHLLIRGEDTQKLLEQLHLKDTVVDVDPLETL